MRPRPSGHQWPVGLQGILEEGQGTDHLPPEVTCGRRCELAPVAQAPVLEWEAVAGEVGGCL